MGKMSMNMNLTQIDVIMDDANMVESMNFSDTRLAHNVTHLLSSLVVLSALDTS
jgi:hypothetical protein